MAFVKLEKAVTGVRTTGPSVRMGSHRTKTGRVVYMSISEHATVQAGFTMISPEGSNRKYVRLLIHEGVGEDRGFWMLAEDDKGYHFGMDHKTTGSMSSHVGAGRLQHYRIRDASDVPVEDVQFTIDEKEHTILIECPDWLRYDPTSYDEPAKEVPGYVVQPPPPKPKVEDKKPSRPTITVVKEVVGEASQVLELNRNARRALTSATTKAMRR